MALTFSIVQRDEQPVLTIRTKTSMRDLPDTILNGLATVGRCMADQNIVPSGPAFVAYYNLDMHDTTVEIGFPISQEVTGDEEVHCRTIPGGPAGVCLYVGPYQELAVAYQQLNAYLEAQGREPSGVSYEFYLNNPAVTPPEELETEIIFPLVQPAVEKQKRPQGNGRFHSFYW